MTRTTTNSGICEKCLDVIVVDDDADTREITTLLLERAGWLVRGIAEPEHALASALDRVPDVVVTDLELRGDADGGALARALRRSPATASVGLVLLTGHHPGPEVVEAFDVFLRKPAGIARLVETVQELGEARRRERIRSHGS